VSQRLDLDSRGRRRRRELGIGAGWTSATPGAAVEVEERASSQTPTRPGRSTAAQPADTHSQDRRASSET
jgi:hypothetical protein